MDVWRNEDDPKVNSRESGPGQKCSAPAPSRPRSWDAFISLRHTLLDSLEGTGIPYGCSVSGGINGCSQHSLIPVCMLSWGEGTRIASTEEMGIKGRGHWEYNSLDESIVVLGLGSAGRAPGAAGKWKSTWCKLYLSIYELFCCALGKTKFVSPPSSVYLGSRLCRTGTWIISSYLIHSFIHSFGQYLLSTNLCLKLCLCALRGFRLVDSKSFCDLLGSTLLSEVRVWWRDNTFQ